MDLSLKDIPLGEVIEQLTKCRDQYGADCKVRIVHSTGTVSCVGKIIGAKNPHGAQVMLFPVPEDIERINRLSKFMAIMTCERAAAGQTCGSCPDLPVCPQMKAIDRTIKEQKENHE